MHCIVLIRMALSLSAIQYAWAVYSLWRLMVLRQRIHRQPCSMHTYSALVLVLCSLRSAFGGRSL